MRMCFNGHEKSSGVYRITNTSNARVYYGSTNKLRHRARDHTSALRRGRHHNVFLQRDYAKCGVDSFVFEVVHVISDETERLDVEQALIERAFGEGCYNATTVCPPAITKFLTAEVRAKMSAARKGKKLSAEHKAKISAALTGGKMHPGFGAAASERMRGVSRGPHTAETKAKMSASKKAAVSKGAWRAGQEAAAAVRKGAVNSTEMRAKISASKKGKPWTAAGRAKQMAARAAKKAACRAAQATLDLSLN